MVGPFLVRHILLRRNSFFLYVHTLLKALPNRTFHNVWHQENVNSGMYLVKKKKKSTSLCGLGSTIVNDSDFVIIS